ncbi:MAG: hypothetical protein FJ319_04885 [SAR202 cluster bacterium]|nr:hypothetical protein [SAR202 cluster bacterium]
MDPALSTRGGGPGWADQRVRDHLFGIVRELLVGYNTQGVELDFAAPPGWSAFHLRAEDVTQYTPVVTEWVRKATETARNRVGQTALIGVRVYPTEEINLAHGVDIRTWLKEGLVDYLSPLVYAHNRIDADTPVEWLVELAHKYNASVYPILMAYYTNEARQYYTRVFATPAMYHAAAASYFDRGCDGMYSWFMRWPLGDTERRTLADIGNPDILRESTKHYVVNRKSDYTDKLGFKRPLPLEINCVDPGKRHAIPFYLADDPVESKGRIHEIRIRMRLHNMVSADRISLFLNGQSLAAEPCAHYRASNMYPYDRWAELTLHRVQPRKGHNVLEISHDFRPERLGYGLAVEDLEVLVKYNTFRDDYEMPKTH